MAALILEDLVRIEMKALKKLGYFINEYKTGTVNITHINCLGEKTLAASIIVTVSMLWDQEFMELEYTNLKGESCLQHIPLVKIKNNKNAWVYYFLCPVANERCWKLYYLPNKGFTHRKAMPGVLYYSQTISTQGRAANKLGNMISKAKLLSKQHQQPYAKIFYGEKLTKKFKELIEINKSLEW